MPAGLAPLGRDLRGPLSGIRAGAGGLASAGGASISYCHPVRWVSLICGPDLFYCLFLAEAMGDFFAWGVGPVPSLSVGGVGECSASGHLEVAVWVVVTDPFPGVFQPVVSVFFGLTGEPADFVVSPDPVRADVLSASSAPAEVVELDYVGQGFAGPSAGGEASFAAFEDAVEVAELEDSLLGLGNHLVYSQWE